MPYASRSGAPKVDSSVRIVTGDNAALHERMNRSRGARADRADEAARFNNNWCTVGTAEYHVTSCSPAVRQNDSALKRDGTTIVPPVASVASSDATKPCT